MNKKTIETLDGERFASWIRNSCEPWESGTHTDACSATETDPPGLDFTCTRTFPNLRLLRLLIDKSPVSVLLYELEADFDVPVLLMHVDTDPAHRRRGYATLLFNQLTQTVEARPIGATDLSVEGRAALLKWGFKKKGDEVMPFLYDHKP